MSVKELREKRVKLVHEGRELLKRAEDEKRSLHSDESEQYDRIYGDINDLNNTIEKLEKQAEIEKGMEERTSQRVAPSAPEAAAKPGKDEARAAFAAYLMRGVRGMSQAEHRALSKGTAAAGGDLSAPEEFVAQLIKEVEDRVDVRRLARKFSLGSSDKLTFPRRSAKMSAPAWTTELGTGTEDAALAFEKVELAPQPLAKRIKVSKTLLRRSAVSAESIVMDEMAREFAETEENAYMTGSGSGEPEGIFTVGEISVGRDISSGNTISSIGFDGLINAKYALKSQYHASAVWLFHRDAISQISKLKDNDDQYLWQPSNQAGRPDQLLGHPVLMNEFVPNTFTTGLYVGAFCDLSHYYIVDVLALEMQRLDELYAETNQIGFIGRKETDGKAVLEEAFARVTLA